MKKRMVRRGKYSDGVRAREKSWYGNKRENVFVLQLSSTWVVEGGISVSIIRASKWGARYFSML